jgi:hypothetical protein
MTGRCWSPWQWQEVLRDRYERITGPTSTEQSTP